MQNRPASIQVLRSAACSLLLLVLLTGCGGGSSTATVAKTPAPDAAAPSPGALPGFPGNTAGPLSAVRQPSAADETYVNGDQAVAVTGASVPGDAGTLQLEPAAGQPLAWASYTLGGIQGDFPVGLDIQVSPLPGNAAATSYWVAVANYTTYRWEMFGPYTDSQTVVLNAPAGGGTLRNDRYVDAGVTGAPAERGQLHWAVLVYSGAGPSGLRINDTLVHFASDYVVTKPLYTPLKGLAPAAGGVTLSWDHFVALGTTNPLTEAKSYSLWRQGPGDSGPQKLAEVGAPGTSFTDGGTHPEITGYLPPQAGAEYLYFVQAVNTTQDGGGVTPLAGQPDAHGVMIPLLTPDAPVVTDGSGGAHLSWNGQGGVKGFELWRAPSNDLQQAGRLVNLPGTAEDYDDPTVGPGQGYYYWLRSRGEGQTPGDGDDIFSGYSQSVHFQRQQTDPPSGWAHTWGGPGGEGAFGTAADGSNNVFVGGFITMDDTAPSLPLLGKYDKDGNLLWYKSYSRPDLEGYLESVRCDAEGNVYALAVDGASGIDANELVKFDTDGNLLWAKQFTGLQDLNLCSTLTPSTAVDSAGDVWLTGFYTVPGSGNGQRSVLLLIEVAPDGSLLSCRSGEVDPAEELRGNSVAMHQADGTLIVAGTIGDSDHDALVMKIGSAAQTVTWAKRIAGYGSGGTSGGVGVDGSGNVYTNGDNHGGETLLKLDTSGSVQWAETWTTGGQGGSWYEGLAVSPDGHVYVTGGLESIKNDPAYDGYDQGLLALQFDSSGALVGQRVFGATWNNIVNANGTGANCSGRAVTVAPDGDIVAVGWAPSMASAWDDASGSLAAQSATATDQDITLSDLSVSLSDVAYTTTDLSGTQDTGGGTDFDLYVQKGAFPTE